MSGYKSGSERGEGGALLLRSMTREIRRGRGAKGGTRDAGADGAACTVNGKVDEEHHAVVDRLVGGRMGQARPEGLDERVGQDDVELPLERLEDDHLLMHELLGGDRVVMQDHELRDRRQLAVEKLGRDEHARGGNHLHLSLADGALAQRDGDVTVEVVARDAARLHL